MKLAATPTPRAWRGAAALGTAVKITHHAQMLKPDPSRTVIRPFVPGDPAAFAQSDHPRARRIADRVLALDHDQGVDELEKVTSSLNERHRDVDTMLLRRFDEVASTLEMPDRIGEERRRLLGAYFSEEYSFEAADLFNTSAVLHRDQSNLPENAVRLALSLRGIGEGHVSSVTFRTGIWTPGGEVAIDAPSGTAVPPVIETEEDGKVHATLRCGGSEQLSETVLFPVLPSQIRGIEDVRLVRFIEDDGSITFHGTYTAVDQTGARSELLTAIDFRSFEMCPLSGSAAEAKGMALFPRRIGGKYVMLGRQDNESIWLMRSDDLYRWDGGAKLLSPRFPWEYIQVGNCGSPIELDEGWLVLTHGVGMVRNYCIGACLLDLDDPSKVLGRTPQPILEPTPTERDGYVPNVVYSCGALVRDRTLLLPYGVADSFTAFCSLDVDDLLATLV